MNIPSRLSFASDEYQNKYARTGDVIMTKPYSNDLSGSVQVANRVYQQSEFSHAGMIVRVSPTRILLLEASPAVPDGIFFTDWDAFTKYETASLYARLVVRQVIF